MTHSRTTILHLQASQIGLLLQETELKSNAGAPSTVNNHETTWHLSVSSWVGHDTPIRPLITVAGYMGDNGEICAKPTPVDVIQAEGCLRQPQSFDVSSKFIWHGKTGFIAHCLQGPDMRMIWRIAASMSTHPLQCYQHCHFSTTSQLTHTTSTSSAHYYSQL